MIDETIGQESRDLVQELLTKVGEGEMSIEEAKPAVSRCVSFLQDKKLLDEIAHEMGMSLSGFQSTAVLEIYYDVGWKGKEFGHIAKGWKDPGFRIGDVITLDDEQVEQFSQNAVKILDVCATQGVGWCPVSREDGLLRCCFKLWFYPLGAR